MILFYVSSDWSLRLVGAWALLTGIGYLSDVAVLKRLRNSKNWIGKLVATTISIPGSQGTDWRVHLSFDLGNLCLDGVEITDKHGGESLARFDAQSNEIFIADGAYPFASSMAPITNTGAGLIVRINWQNVPSLGPEGRRFETIPWLKTVTTLSEKQIWMDTPQGWLQFRLIASPIPPVKLEEVRTSNPPPLPKKTEASQRKHTFRCRVCSFADQFARRNWSGHLVLTLYRMRWQIELCIKELKSLLNFDHLRAKDPRVVQTYLLAKMLIAFMMDASIHHVSLQYSRLVRSLNARLVAIA